MKLPKILFIIGLIMLVIGIVVAASGPALVIRREAWRSKSLDLYEDLVATVYAGWKYWYVPYVGPLIISEAKDFRVKGNITEVAGCQFNFYIFNATNYELWSAGYPYVAYVEAENTSAYSFLFYPTKEDYGGLRFVVENRGTADIVTKLSATMEWSEKEVVEPVIAAGALFVLGGLVGFIGFILIIVAAIAKYIFKPGEPSAEKD